MGHIANKDLEKANLAESTWQSLKFSLAIPFGILIIPVLIGYLLLKLLNFAYPETDNLFLLMLQKIGVGFTLYFIYFLIIVYVLHKQIIRLREFYADAKVLEWEKSPEKMIETLKESSGEHQSKYKILTKFHPNIDERIHVLQNNSMLFTPDLWVAFNIGFFYIMFLSIFVSLYDQFSDFYWTSLGSGIKYQIPPILIPYALVTIFVFLFFMPIVSSSFHKLILKVKFIEKKDIISASTILSIISFSLVFSFGMQITNIHQLLYFGNVIYNIGFIIDNWIFAAFYFFLTLIFLLIFGSILIKRSFSKKEAEKNFVILTVFSYILYIVSRLISISVYKPNKQLFEMPPGLPFVIIFFLIYSFITFAIIKIRDKKLICPGCGKKIIIDFQSNCPNCQHNLYSWAIYSF